jgi:hypothetical protein
MGEDYELISKGSTETPLLSRNIMKSRMESQTEMGPNSTIKSAPASTSYLHAGFSPPPSIRNTDPRQ